MFSSKDYWETRYRDGGNSGVGSYQKFAEFKAEFVNNLLELYSIETVLEFGVGDGNQLSYLKVKNYVGIDVSRTAIERCKSLYANDTNKSFVHKDDFIITDKADMTLSMDVIYHLIEDEVFEQYMEDLFESSKCLVCIYASNTESQLGEDNTAHVKHRKFSDWVVKNRPDSRLVYYKQNKYPYNGDYKTTSFSNFYVYRVA
tara:strand:+ start:6042 stop:6644 length:603 start_codon:yes stop_codon:yes gene_type:complete